MQRRSNFVLHVLSIHPSIFICYDYGYCLCGLLLHSMWINKYKKA